MITIVFFKQNFRIQDNRTLNQALAYNDPILPVVCLNQEQHQKEWFGWPSLGNYRQQFLFESISALQSSCQKLGANLWITTGTMVDVVSTIHNDFKDCRVVFPTVLGHYERIEEDNVKEFCKQQDIACASCWDWTLLDDVDISRVSLGFSSFRKKVEKHMAIAQVAPTPNHLPAVEHSYKNTKLITSANTSLILNGGEKAAHQHMAQYIWESKALNHYKQTRNKLIGKHVSSKFSLYLSHGCLSARQIYHEVKAFEKKYAKNVSTYWLIFELLWRDFFQFQYLKHAEQWFEFGGIQNKHWEPPQQDDNKCRAWANGETDNEFINATMIELINTGYMSNRGRQNAASYLIFDLGQDWRFGAAVFEHYLIDYDVASNIGNWMYIAGVGNSRSERIFNTNSQQHRYDPHNEFTNYWLNYKQIKSNK